MIHIYPESEEAEHELEGTCCPCGVTVNWQYAEAIAQHQAFDGRRITDATEDMPWILDT